MPGKESHSIRNAIIATVIGGIILSIILSVREFLSNMFFSLWTGLLWLWKLVVADYALPGWVIFLFGLFSIITLCHFLGPIIKREALSYSEYKSDFFHGAKWRWDWVNNKIFNLWCYCPKCDSELVFGHQIPAYSAVNEIMTEFTCEHCGNIKATSLQGDRDHAISTIEREIRRNVRTGEYKSTLGKTN